MGIYTEITDIDDCLLYHKWTTNEHYLPAHFIIVDHLLLLQ